MKFYNIDLSQITPYGIPINNNNHVEYTGYINDFFLKGFENYFKQLFVVDENEKLITDFSRSCMAPTTAETCAYCTDDQLRDAITEAGFVFYSANNHSINSQFLNDINTIPFGSERYLTAIAKYISNTDLVHAYAEYNDVNPYKYSITFEGDITASENVESITERMIENLKIVGTAHTLCRDFIFEDTGSTIGCYTSVTADDAVNEYNVELKLPREDTDIISDFLSTTFTGSQTFSGLPLRGSMQIPSTYVSYNTARFQMYDFIYLGTHKYKDTKPYPLIGYSDIYLYYYSSTRSYLFNEALLMPQELSTADGSIKAFRINKYNFNSRSYSEFKKEKMYNNMGVRQQVFSVVTNGYRRYIDAHILFTQAKAPVMSEIELAENGYYKDKHFYAFAETSGLPTTISSTPNILYYKNNSSSSPAPVDHPFLYDDAYDYEIQAVYSGSGKENLGDIFASTVSEVTQDDNNNPIDFNNFVISFDNNHNLQISYPNAISNVVFIRFSIKQKENCLVFYPTSSGALTVITTSTASNLYKIYASAIQPNTTIESNRFGDNMACFGVYSCSDSNFQPKYFKSITEAQAFLGYCNSDTLFTFNNNIETIIDGNYAKIKAVNTTIQRVAFVSCSFESLHRETLALEWNNPNDNKTFSISLSNNLCFGASNKYATAITYVVDEVNGNTSLSNIVTAKVRGKFNAVPDYLDLTYHGDNSIPSITSIKIHGSYPDD